MATLPFEDKVVANMLADTADTFIHKNHVYRRQNRELLMLVNPVDSKGIPWHKLSSHSIYSKSNFLKLGSKEDIDSIEYHTALKEFQKNYDFNNWIDDMFDQLTESPYQDELMRLILTSELM